MSSQIVDHAQTSGNEDALDKTKETKELGGLNTGAIDKVFLLVRSVWAHINYPTSPSQVSTTQVVHPSSDEARTSHSSRIRVRRGM